MIHRPKGKKKKNLLLLFYIIQESRVKPTVISLLNGHSNTYLKAPRGRRSETHLSNHVAKL